MEKITKLLGPYLAVKPRGSDTVWALWHCGVSISLLALFMDGLTEQIPDEVWMLILSFLPYQDIMVVAGVNRMLNNLTEDQKLWQSLFLQEHGKQKYKRYQMCMLPFESWRLVTILEMVKQNLHVKRGTLYKKDTEFGTSRWVNRTFSLSRKYITYSLPDPLRGVYVSPRLKSNEQKNIHLKNVVDVVSKEEIVYKEITFYCFEVKEKVFGLKKFAKTHTFGATDPLTAREWQKAIQNHATAYKCWKYCKKNTPEDLLSKGRMITPRRASAE